jgi:hypothetical protein
MFYLFTGFLNDGTISIGAENDIAYQAVDNLNARTLQGFSLQAQEKMYECEFCPYTTYEKFYNYYQEFDYGDKWVMAAFEGGSTNFAGNGDADFSVYQDAGIVESIKKGTAYLNVWMYVSTCATGNGRWSECQRTVSDSSQQHHGIRLFLTVWSYVCFIYMFFR